MSGSGALEGFARDPARQSQAACPRAPGRAVFKRRWVTALRWSPPSAALRCLPYNLVSLDAKEIESILAAHRTELDSYGVGEVLLFGSQARGDARPDSDVDLIVEFRKALGLVDYMDLLELLKRIFGRHVDVMSSDSLQFRPDKAPYLLAEARKVA